MPASPDARRVALRVGASAAAACFLLVGAVWHAAQPRQGNAQSAVGPRSGLTALLEAGGGAEPAGKRGGREPVLTSLLETQLTETCDCSKPKPCEEVIETDVKQKLPGGGAGGLSQNDWGAWDPVTGVPRIGCPDTVTHAHCTPALCAPAVCPPRPSLGPARLRPPAPASAAHALRVLTRVRVHVRARHSLQGRRRVARVAHEPLLRLDDVRPAGQGHV